MKVKMKTNRGAAKRFRVRKSGSIKFAHAKRRHLLGGKRQKNKRQGRGPATIKHVDEKLIRRCLPNG